MENLRICKVATAHCLTDVFLCSRNMLCAIAGVQMPQVEVERLAHLVTAQIPHDRMPGTSLAQKKEAQDKLVGCVCSDMLRMETEHSATAYKELLTQTHKRFCSTILCADNGAMVSSSGIVGGGASHRAPVLTPQQPCYGQIPREQTPKFQFWANAIKLLLQAEDLQPSLRQAQVNPVWLLLQCRISNRLSTLKMMHV